jgi:hypothetical protein
LLLRDEDVFVPSFGKCRRRKRWGSPDAYNISITSNNNDPLASFGLELLITPSPMATSLLQFTSSQADPTSTANYVFLGECQSADSGGALPFWSSPTITNYNNDTIIAGDADDSNQGYLTIGSMLGASHTYLATVQF